MDIGNIYPSRIIDYHDNLGVRKDIPLGNMSFCGISDNRMIVSVRQFNYSLDPVTAKGRLFGRFEDDRAYHMILADRRFEFIDRIQCEGLEYFEDLRLMRYGNVIQASGTDISYGQKQYRIVCVDLSSDDQFKSLKIAEKKTFAVPHEKNYVPVQDGKGVFVSDMLNGEILIASTVDLARKTTQRCTGLSRYSGSSQLLRYRDGYVALVHRREKRKYVNAFAFFDKRMTNCRISDEFTVFSGISRVNFNCGMSIDGEKAIVPFCIHDRETHIFELPIKDFSMTARWRM